jgi:hypothetical protein
MITGCTCGHTKGSHALRGDGSVSECNLCGCRGYYQTMYEDVGTRKSQASLSQTNNPHPSARDINTDPKGVTLEEQPVPKTGMAPSGLKYEPISLGDRQNVSKRSLVYPTPTQPQAPQEIETGGQPLDKPASKVPAAVSSAIDTFKEDVESATWMMVGMKAPEVARAPLLALLRKQNLIDDDIARAGEKFLSSPGGKILIGMILGHALPALPIPQAQHPLVQKACAATRIMALAEAEGLIVDAVIENAPPIFDAITNLIPARLRAGEASPPPALGAGPEAVHESQLNGAEEPVGIHAWGEQHWAHDLSKR